MSFFDIPPSVPDPEGRRGYCGRIGHAIKITVPCNECGHREGHKPFADQTLCHDFAACKNCGWDGHPCEKTYKHDGPCAHTCGQVPE